MQFLSVAVFATSIDFDWPKTDRRMLLDPNAMSGASCNSLRAGVSSIEVELLKVSRSICIDFYKVFGGLEARIVGKPLVL